MAEQDTSIGAGQSAFARTRWTEILRARAGSPEAHRDLVERLAAAYWRPVYKFIRVALRKGNEEAKDLTQDFFAAVFQPEWIARADPARGSFRTFLLASLKNFVRDSEKYQGARKRGGGLRPTPIEDAGEEMASEGLTPEQVFLRSWAEATLAEALRELREGLDARGREKVFQTFREFCIDSEPGQEVSYRAVAAKLGLSEADVTNYLSEARRELRRILVGKVGQYAGSPREIDEELRELFGA